MKYRKVYLWNMKRSHLVDAEANLSGVVLAICGNSPDYSAHWWGTEEFPGNKDVTLLEVCKRCMNLLNDREPNAEIISYSPPPVVVVPELHTGPTAFPLPENIEVPNMALEVKSPADFVRIWIERLRSNDYLQGVGALREINADANEPDTFCCIGVGCEIGRSMGLLSRVKIQGTYEYGPRTDRPARYRSLLDFTSGTMPVVLQSYLKINETRAITSQLIAMNDRDGRSFSAIADYLETEVLPMMEEAE